MPGDPAIVFEYEEGGNTEVAFIDVKTGYDKDSVGYSIFRALLQPMTDPSLLRKWKMVQASVPDQDRNRRTLRLALENQYAQLNGALNNQPGQYQILGNFRLKPRRGYQRLEFWI